MNKILTLCFALTILIVLSFSLHAADGDLDPSFGTGGKVTSDFGGGPDAGFAMTTDELGRIVVVGQAWWHNQLNMAVFRYKRDGSLDTSLYGTGHVAFDYTTESYGRAIAVEPSDHKIILAGQAYYSNNIYFLRFDQDLASLEQYDFNFANAGGGGSSYDTVSSVVLDASEKILVGASSYAGSGTNRKFAFVRFNSDFSIDTSFNAGGGVPGIRLEDFLGNENEMHAMLLDAGGKILAAGDSQNGTNLDFALVRLNSDGTLDSTFGTGGKVRTDTHAGADSHANALALQADGKILIAGVDGSGQPIVIRYNTDGTRDSTFGTGGFATVNVTGSFTGIAVQSDGKIVASGHISTAEDFALVRLNGDGTLDTNFGNSGTVLTDFQGGVDMARAILVQQDDRIVIAGSAENAPGGVTDFALARYGCLFCDDFDGSALDAAKWTVITPDFSESLGNLLGSPAKKKAFVTASGFSGCGRCSFETTMATVGGPKNKVGFYPWYQDSNNNVQITMLQEKGAFLLKQKAGGVLVAKGKYRTPINVAQFYKVRAEYDGTYLKLQIDDVQALKVATSARPFGSAAYFVKSTIGGFGYIEVK